MPTTTDMPTTKDMGTSQDALQNFSHATGITIVVIIIIAIGITVGFLLRYIHSVFLANLYY